MCAVLNRLVGRLSQMVVQKEELSEGLEGGSGHLMATRPHVTVVISRIDTRRYGELRDCGVSNSGRGLETMGREYAL